MNSTTDAVQAWAETIIMRTAMGQKADTLALDANHQGAIIHRRFKMV